MSFTDDELDPDDPMNGLGEWGEQPLDDHDDDDDDFVRLRDNY